MKKVFISGIVITILIGCQKEPLQENVIDQDVTLSAGASNRTVAPSVLEWQKCLGGNTDEWGWAVAKGTTGGYLAAATINYNTEGYISWYNPVNGTVKSTFIGGSKSEYVRGVVASDDGGYLVVGETNSPEMTGYYPDGNYDIMVARFSATGDKEWVKVFGTPGDEHCLASIKTSDGGLAISGYNNSSLLFIKLDANTNVEWQATYATESTKGDVGYGLVETPDAYVIAGRTMDVNTSSDILVVRINKSDRTATGKKIGDSGIEEIGFGIATKEVAGTSNELLREFVITGRKGQDLITLKLDAQLNVITQRTFGGTGADEARAIVATITGYVLVGSTNSKGGDIINPKGGTDFWVLRIDNDLNKISSHNLGGNRDDLGYAVIAESDGYVAVGKTNSTGGNVSGKSGGTDMWLVKFKF